MAMRRIGGGWRRGGPVGLILRWLVRALGLGFVLGAAVGVRAAKGEAAGDARAMVDRVERALRVLAGRDDGRGDADGEGVGEGPSEGDRRAEEAP
jgi:hypothetical protein